MDEFALYEEIKKNFTVEKGKVLIIKVTSNEIGELVPEIFDNLDDLCDRVTTYAAENQPYAVFDCIQYEKPVYRFRGRTFMQAQVIATGEIFDFAVYSQKPITAEDIKRDFARLSLILRNPEAL